MTIGLFFAILVTELLASIHYELKVVSSLKTPLWERPYLNWLGVSRRGCSCEFDGDLSNIGDNIMFDALKYAGMTLIVVSLVLFAVLGIDATLKAEPLANDGPIIYQQDGALYMSTNMFYPAMTDTYGGGYPADRPVFAQLSGRIARMVYISGESFAELEVVEYSNEYLARTDGGWKAVKQDYGYVFVPFSIWGYPFPDGFPVSYVGGPSQDWRGHGYFQNGEVFVPSD